MALPGNDLLTQVENSNGGPEAMQKLCLYIRQHLQTAIEKTASNAAVSPVSNIGQPAPPESVDVTPATSGDMFQVVVNHTAEIQKGAHYIYSIATNPQFSGAIIEAKPATRAPAHFSHPTFASDGTTKHNIYVSVQVQYPGSLPSSPVFHGGVSAAPIQLNGTAAADIQPGTGSGTAQNGGQPFVGLGKAQVRLQAKSKRQT